MPDPDIKAFAESVGANDAIADDVKLRRLFRRRNYYSLNGRFLIVKVSRINPPFWGVGKKYIDFLNGLPDYSLVLLTTPTEGWVFSKSQINNHINSGQWKLREADGNYKIHSPLPDTNAFSIAARFLSKIAE